MAVGFVCTSMLKEKVQKEQAEACHNVKWHTGEKEDASDGEQG